MKEVKIPNAMTFFVNPASILEYNGTPQWWIFLQGLIVYFRGFLFSEMSITLSSKLSINDAFFAIVASTIEEFQCTSVFKGSSILFYCMQHAVHIF